MMDRLTAIFFVGWPILSGDHGLFDPFASTALFIVNFWTAMALWLWDALLRLTIFLKCRILRDKKAPCLPIMSLSPEPRTPTETALDIGNEDKEQDLDDVSDKAIPFKMKIFGCK
jgi:hypothetical protein